MYKSINSKHRFICLWLDNCPCNGTTNITTQSSWVTVHFIGNVISYQKCILAANWISTYWFTKENMILFGKPIRRGELEAVFKENWWEKSAKPKAKVGRQGRMEKKNIRRTLHILSRRQSVHIDLPKKTWFY